MTNIERFDVTIIGGGAAGLFAAYYAGMRNMKTKIIDALPHLGGTITTFYPDKPISDVGGIPKIYGRDLVQQLTEQAMMFDPTLVMGEAVDLLEKMDDHTWALTTRNGDVHYSKTVILAVGPGLFHVRPLRLENLEHYEHNHVHYNPADLTRFENQRVAVFAGVNTALQQARELAETAQQVTVISKNKQFKGFEKDEAELEASSAAIQRSSSITALHGDGKDLSAITVKDQDSGNEKRIPVDELIVNQSYTIDLDPVKRWGFSLEGRRIPVNEKMATAQAGIYTAGDIAGYTNKWRLIASAFNEAITAVNSAKARLDPTAPAQVYSSIIMDND